MSPEIAVLTPVRGHARYLAPMLRSLQAQTCAAWECAIVLDGPDDEAEAIARAFAHEDPRITVDVLPAWHGLPTARNIAAANTRAPWLLPFDADDTMDPTFLAALLAAGQQHNPLGTVVFTPARCEFPNGRTQVHRYPPFDAATFADTLQVTGAALRRRALWETLGGWHPAWRHGAEDWHFYCRAVARGLLHLVQLDRPLWTYRQHDGPRNSRVGEQRWPELQPQLRAALAGA